MNQIPAYNDTSNAEQLLENSIFLIKRASTNLQ